MIPASKEWLGLYSDALLSLTQAWNYEQISPTDLTPDETAALAWEQYIAWLDSTCAGSTPCPDPEIPDMDTPIYRRNPTTGRWEYIGPDGWEEPSGENAIPSPADRPEATEPLQECGAASNAANSLKALYEDILAVYDSQVDPLLNQIEIAAQIAVAYGSIFGPISSSVLAYSGAAWETFTYLLDQVTMPSWTTAWHTKLVCILNSNVTMVDGKAHFDFFNVNNALVGFLLPVIDDYVKVRWQVWYMLQCIGSQGLDLAGATTAVSGNCVTCDTWCVNLTPSELGFTVTLGSYNSSGQIIGVLQSNRTISQANRVIDTTNCIITRVGMTFLSGQSHTGDWSLNPTPSVGFPYWSTYVGTPFDTTILSPDNVAWYTTEASTTLYLSLTNYWKGPSTIKKVRIMGTGINPFGIGSNC